MATIRTEILFEKGTGRAKPFEETRVDGRLASGEWFRTVEEARPPQRKPEASNAERRAANQKPERPAAASDEG